MAAKNTKMADKSESLNIWCPYMGDMCAKETKYEVSMSNHVQGGGVHRLHQ